MTPTRTRRPSSRTERFSLALAPGDKRTLLVLLGLGTTGLVTVRRAAVRSAHEHHYAAEAAAQMYRTARNEAPVALIPCHPADTDPAPLTRELRKRVGPFADIVPVETEPGHRPGTWGVAIRGAASGLGFMLGSVPDAVLMLARECEMRATGGE